MDEPRLAMPGAFARDRDLAVPRIDIPEAPELEFGKPSVQRKVQVQLDALQRIASLERHQEDSATLTGGREVLEKLRDHLAAAGEKRASMAAVLNTALQEEEATRDQLEQVTHKARLQSESNARELAEKNGLTYDLDNERMRNEWLDKRVDAGNRKLQKLLREVTELRGEVAVQLAIKNGLL